MSGTLPITLLSAGLETTHTQINEDLTPLTHTQINEDLTPLTHTHRSMKT